MEGNFFAQESTHIINCISSSCVLSFFSCLWKKEPLGGWPTALDRLSNLELHSAVTRQRNMCALYFRITPCFHLAPFAHQNIFKSVPGRTTGCGWNLVTLFLCFFFLSVVIHYLTNFAGRKKYFDDDDDDGLWSVFIHLSTLIKVWVFVNTWGFTHFRKQNKSFPVFFNVNYYSGIQTVLTLCESLRLSQFVPKNQVPPEKFFLNVRNV